MANNLGKNFETKFREQWAKTVPNSFCFRLNDQMSGYIGASKNPCDMICYQKPLLFLFELKSHKGNTFPFTAFRQYEELIQYKDIEGLKAGVILWLIELDKVLYIPIETFIKIKENDLKSFNYKVMKDDPEYVFFEIPSKKLRTFMNTDYSKLVEWFREHD